MRNFKLFTVIIAAFCMIGITSCDDAPPTNNTTRTPSGNSQKLTNTSGEDLDMAEEIINLFFEKMKMGEYVGTFEFMSDEYWLYTDKSTMLEIYRVIERDLGFLQETKLVSREFKEGPGNRGGMAYYFEYRNTYEKYEANEAFILIENEFGQYRIFAYDIQSEGFVQPEDEAHEQQITIER